MPGQLRERVDQDTVLAMVNEVCTDILPPEFWSRTNAEALKAYTLDAFLAFMAAHGYVLRPSRRALPFHNLEVTSGAFKDGSLAQVVPPMDAKLALWRKNLKHVPAILVDFHDLKDVFKAMHAVWLPGLSGPATTIGVMDGTCYIFDCFLW
ncbi:MAG: hypothetical protein RSD49_08325, partial [Hafnia sp.]